MVLHFDQMETERRTHRPGKFARRKSKSDIGKFRHHLTALKPIQIASLGGAARVLAGFARHGGKILAAPDAFFNGFNPVFGLLNLVGGGVFRHENKNMSGAYALGHEK